MCSLHIISCYTRSSVIDKHWLTCCLPHSLYWKCKAAYQSLLIADQHCRTRKYLLSLASGVPCVSHLWVRDCCKENKLLNYRNYLLPAGVAPDQAIVEWYEAVKQCLTKIKLRIPKKWL